MPITAQPEQIDYDALFTAIAIVESENGATSKNVYQIQRSYFLDVCRFRRLNVHPESYDCFCEIRPLAEDIMMMYWDYYGDKVQRRIGNPITAETLARLHRCGFVGYWTKWKTGTSYWKRVKKNYDILRRKNQK